MTVVNANEFVKVFASLGWGNLSPSEVAEKVHQGGWDPAGVLAFCRALVASPNGLDPSTVTALPANERDYVVDYFKSKGVVV